jgi:hypothetical protein
MARLTPAQVRTRNRVEAVIRLLSPALDLLLATGERVSRVVGSEDREPVAARVVPAGGRAPRAVPRRTSS